MTRPTSAQAAPARRAAGPVRAIVAAALAAAALAACEGARIPDEVHPKLTDPARRHPIVVAAETATLDLAIVPASSGAEARQYVETTRFLRSFRQEARSPLIVWVPHQRSHGRSVSGRMHAIRTLLAREGISPRRVRIASKPGPTDLADTITLSYDRIAAIGPTCGDWSESVTRNPHNLPYPNYGCASQRNLAAMIANPTDLMFPAHEIPRQGERRAATYKGFTETAPPAGTTAAAGSTRN